MPERSESKADYEPGTVEEVIQHDGSTIRLHKLNDGYDATDRIGASNYLHARAEKGEVVTGLIYVEKEPEDLHAHLNTVDAPLNSLAERELCPGTQKLQEINEGLR